MPRTLAEMTPQEREECKGMWVEFLGVGETTKAILTHVRHGKCSLFSPASISNYTGYTVDEVTLLPDLPRAWGKDGEPVKGKKND